MAPLDQAAGTTGGDTFSPGGDKLFQEAFKHRVRCFRVIAVEKAAAAAAASAVRWFGKQDSGNGGEQTPRRRQNFMIVFQVAGIMIKNMLCLAGREQVRRQRLKARGKESGEFPHARGKCPRLFLSERVIGKKRRIGGKLVKTGGAGGENWSWGMLESGDISFSQLPRDFFVTGRVKGKPATALTLGRDCCFSGQLCQTQGGVACFGLEKGRHATAEKRKRCVGYVFL